MEYGLSGVPIHLKFSDLELRRGADGVLRYNERVVLEIAVAIGLTYDQLIRDEIFTEFILRWYLHYRRHGGPHDRVMELLMEEYRARKDFGAALQPGSSQLQ